MYMTIMLLFISIPINFSTVRVVNWDAKHSQPLQYKHHTLIIIIIIIITIAIPWVSSSSQWWRQRTSSLQTLAEQVIHVRDSHPILSLIAWYSVITIPPPPPSSLLYHHSSIRCCDHMWEGKVQDQDDQEDHLPCVESGVHYQVGERVDSRLFPYFITRVREPPPLTPLTLQIHHIHKPQRIQPAE